MAYRTKTLRRLPPTTRRVAKLINAQESVTRRLKNLLPAIERLELDSRALFNMEAHHLGAPQEPAELFKE